MADSAGMAESAGAAARDGMPGDVLPIERLKAQDHDTFAALVEQHYGAVHRYLARLLADADAAAELAQETFLRAYRGVPRLADNSNLRAWLFRIATNLARQHHRHRRLIGWSDVSRLDGQQATSGRFEDDVAQQDLVRHALERLPLNEKVCLLLYAWSGYTCPEIGEVLGKSTDAVRMLLVRARRRFRVAYGAGLDWLDEEGGSDQENPPPSGSDTRARLSQSRRQASGAARLSPRRSHGSAAPASPPRPVAADPKQARPSVSSSALLLRCQAGATTNRGATRRVGPARVMGRQGASLTSC